MGFRFRKSIKVAPGVRINLSRSGIGSSVGIPGTGISWVSSPRRSKASAVTLGCGGCLGLMFLGLFGMCLLGVFVPGCEPDRPRAVVVDAKREPVAAVKGPMPSRQPNPVPDAGSVRLRPGERVMVVVPGAILVMLGATPEDLLRFTKAKFGGDMDTIEAMHLQGRAIPVRPNSRAVVVEAGDLMAKIRIEGGDRSGAVGWIDTESLVSTGQARTSQGRPAKEKHSVERREQDPETANRQRAETTFALGKALEGSNPTAAVDYYRQLVEEFPDSPEAKLAAGRIEALKPKAKAAPKPKR